MALPLRLATLALALAAAAAAWSGGDVGIDRYGADMPGSPFNLARNSTEECYAACFSTPGCAAWAVNPCVSPAQCWLKESVAPLKAASCRASGTMNSSLLPPAFAALPVGAVRPSGWLRRELEITAAGLAGHLHLFWPDIMSSSWLGGTADGGLHERFPYWFNGVAQMAYQLQDEGLMATVQNLTGTILARQGATGWLGLDDTPTGGDQYWGRYYLLYALISHFEATGDARVPPAILRFMVEARNRLWQYPMGDSWSGARWQDFAAAAHWMLENAPQGQEQLLWDLAEVLHTQGVDWNAWFSGPEFPHGNVGDGFGMRTHGVNNGQAIKTPGVWYRQSHNVLDADAAPIAMTVLDQYHGMANGMFGCDEHLAGSMPSHGTELCTIVEASYSYAVLHSTFGDAKYAERAEMIAYNALPAAFTKDMWDHPYLEQVNELSAAHTDPHVWITDGADSTIYGLEPNYGCCTANFPQGWPKFVARMIGKATADEGIAISMLGPVTATLTLKGAAVTVNVTTDYPFGDDVTVAVRGAPPGTPLYLRIPSWAATATVAVGGGAPVPVGAAAVGTMFRIALPAADATVVLATNPTVRLTHWAGDAVSVHRGALLYSLQLPENVTVLAQHAFASRDLQVTSPNGTVWNVALVLPDPSRPETALTYTPLGAPGAVPFSPASLTGTITAKARAVHAWGVVANAAGPPPQSPVCAAPRDCGELITVTLVPHGATLLRVGVLPWAAA